MNQFKPITFLPRFQVNEVYHLITKLLAAKRTDGKVICAYSEYLRFDFINVAFSINDFVALCGHCGLIAIKSLSSHEPIIHATKCEIRIPNREAYQFYRAVLIEKLVELLTNDKNLSDSLIKKSLELTGVVDLENAYTFFNSIENWLEGLGGRVYLNEDVFHALIETAGFLFDERFAMTSEVKSRTGFADTVYYPVRRGNGMGSSSAKSLIIHEYKFTQETGLVENLLQHALWQIFLKEYLTRYLQLEKTYSMRCEQVLLRGVVILVPKEVMPVKVIFQEIQLPLAKAIELYEVFQKAVEEYGTIGKDTLHLVIDRCMKTYGKDFAALVMDFQNEKRKELKIPKAKPVGGVKAEKSLKRQRGNGEEKAENEEIVEKKKKSNPSTSISKGSVLNPPMEPKWKLRSNRK